MAFSLPFSDTLLSAADHLLTSTGQGLVLVMLAGLVFVVTGAVLPRWVRPVLLVGAVLLASQALTEPNVLPALLLSQLAG